MKLSSSYPFLFSILFDLFLITSQTPAMAFQEVMESANENPEVVEIVSTGMNFEGPSEISSGWTTFRYVNESEETHFFVLEKMPGNKNSDDTRKEIIPIFVEAMNMINSGNADQGYAAFDNLPAWFFDVVFTGGPGLISPGGTAETTVELEPGTYVIECYVKMPNGQFHSALGMVSQIIVTGNENQNPEPTATGEITISADRGIEFEGTVLPGSHTFSVNFENQTVHENFLGHDVHLVRLGEDADLQGLNAWMNWADPYGFITPTPQGITFLGGTQELPAGKKAYFNAEIIPGDYVLISEVPDPESKNMFVRFSVLPKKER